MNCKLVMFTILLAANTVTAQTKLYTKNATVSFKSKTAMENIEAVNNKVLSVWDTNTGNIEFSLLIKGFEFDRALMQEHFNENYLESDKFPKAIFKGVIENSKNILFSSNTNYKVNVRGELNLHGVVKQIIVPATITIKNGQAAAVASFSVVPQDYNIKIPSLVEDKINKKIDILIQVSAYKNLTTQ